MSLARTVLVGALLAGFASLAAANCITTSAPSRKVRRERCAAVLGWAARGLRAAGASRGRPQPFPSLTQCYRYNQDACCVSGHDSVIQEGACGLRPRPAGGCRSDAPRAAQSTRSC